MGYGQDNEDDVILAELPDGFIGRFLDIGAYDGANISNTRVLREAGWEGTLVEPGVKAFMSLVGVCGDNPKMTLVHAIVTAQLRGLTKWWERGMASTTYEHMADRASANMKWTPDQWDIFLNVQVTVQDLFNAAPGPYHVISIDTEGDSVSLLEQMDLTKLRTMVVCIEYEDRRQPTIDHCKAHGVSRIVFDNGCNIILAA